MNARPAQRLILIAMALSLPLALAGCGNKGPLFLPPKNVPVDPSHAAAGRLRRARRLRRPRDTDDRH